MRGSGFLVGAHPIARGLRKLGRPLRAALSPLGFDIVPRNAMRSFADVRTRFLKELGVDIVIDAGANEGQYASGLRAQGYSGTLVSFEPISEPFTRLNGRASSDAHWIVQQMALGDAVSEVEIGVAGNSYSSSILDMLSTHVDALPVSRTVRKETVRVARLDTVLPGLVSNAAAATLFLKADVQGYEDRVISGSAAIMQQVAMLELEVSFVPLYDGQTLFPALHGLVCDPGFELVALDEGFRNLETGRLLQGDALYVRKGLPHVTTKPFGR